MSIYKITNITHLASKRDFKYNSILDIEYIEDMTKKIIKIAPNETVFFTAHSLPLSVHKLRVMNLVTVSEASQLELEQSMNKAKASVEPIAEVEEKPADVKMASGKKRSKHEEIDS